MPRLAAEAPQRHDKRGGGVLHGQELQDSESVERNRRGEGVGRPQQYRAERRSCPGS